MTEENPLVSIIVITYNSAKYVLETLESAKAQTYKNIELIISDDCSTDNTVEICREWLENNSSRFIRTELITVEKNTGIPANCNRGVKAATGVWVKLIAGDDILFTNCIFKNLEYISKVTNVNILFSRICLFENDVIKETFPKEHHLKYFNALPSNQYNQLLIENFVWVAPSMFVKRMVFSKLEYFDINYPFLEDYPFWLKATKNNIPLTYFEEKTVYYRTGDSVSRSSYYWINKNYYQSLRTFYYDKISLELKGKDYITYMDKRLYFLRYKILIFCFNNKKTILAKIFNRIIYKLSNSLLMILEKLYTIRQKCQLKISV